MSDIDCAKWDGGSGFQKFKLLLVVMRLLWRVEGQVVNEDFTFWVIAWTLAFAMLLLGTGFVVFSRRAGTEKAGGGVATAVYRLWDVGVVLLLFVMFAGGALMSLPGDGTGELDADIMVSSIVILFMIAGVVTVLVTLRESPAAWLGLRWSGWRHVIWIGPCGVVLMWAIMGGLFALGYMDWMERLGADSVQETVKVLQDSEDLILLGLTAVAALVAAPWCEEVIFRGYCYPVLKKFAGAAVAAVVTSLVFACVHGNLAGLLPLFLLGMLLVAAYERTRSIWAPVAIHFCFNAATVVVQLYARWADVEIFERL